MKPTFFRVPAVVLCLLFLGNQFACSTSSARGAAGTQPTTSPASQPFVMNGWQFHDYNIPFLEEAVRKAPDYGVNFLIFSHDFFRSVDAFLASTDDVDPQHPPAWTKEITGSGYFKFIPHWQSDLNHIGAMAAERGIPYYLWVHEFDDVPKRFVSKDKHLNMDDPELWSYLEQRYEKLIAAVPGCAGFVLTLHESQYKLFRNENVTSKDDVPTRIVRVASLLHKVLKRHDKQLIIRNFFYEPLEMEYFARALDQLPDDVIAMSKDVVHDFHPFYPFDPMHGRVGNKRQILEMDLGIEKAWSTRGAYAQTDYIRRVVQRAREKGLVGLVGRCRMIGDHPFDDSHEVNLYAFSRLMRDPDLPVNAILTDWAAKRYPANAVPYVAAAMKRSEFIHHHGRWHLENWLTKWIGEEWGSYPYYFGHVLERSRFKWTNDVDDEDLEEKLYHPDEETFKKLVGEKDEVIKQARAAIADVRNAARYCTAEQIAALSEDFRFLLDAALLQREWIRAYFAMRMYTDKASAESKMICEDALERLEQIERTPGVTYGLNPDTGRRYNIDAFVLEMRWRLANRSRARGEDVRLLEETKKVGDVANR